MSDNKKTPGLVYIGSMILYGPRAKPLEGVEYICVNATSAQRKLNQYRIAFSPMTFKPFKGFANLEAWWQAHKNYKDINRSKQLKYWRNIKKAKRRYPNSKNKRVMFYQLGDSRRMNYIESRKEAYVTGYYEKIKDEPELKKLIQLHKQGKNIIVYDFDGPYQGQTPVALEVTEKLLREKINDPERSFGHGYVIAGLIKGIPIDSYIGDKK